MHPETPRLPPHLLPDFEHHFQAYRDADIRFLEALAAPERQPDPLLILDFFGMRVDPDYEPAQAHRRGTVIDRPPFPGDTLLSGGIEYAALALALQSAGEGFAVVEVGAGWGPWVTLATLCARRLGKRRIAITAAEADPLRFQALRRHLDLNGLVPLGAPDAGAAGDLAWRLHQAVVWPHAKGALWPGAALGDAGRRAVEAAPSDGADYRGHALPLSRQASIPLPTLLEAHAAVDLLHMDVQGTEAALLAGALPVLNDRVRLLCVATHSRRIEGALLDLLFGAGWRLEREEPCFFPVAQPVVSLDALTQADGCQVWRNPRLGG
ncbi:class I SAM-dependent methyltransferase [Paracraurococcus ruber]|uniref:FkbM family methyltransferase n=1 Tax=Paracraurococcus ruber TaxID=77675 RepID=A0ABS1D4I9_9PROT|nr:hypothetical protein [Paracraurococcus ruber]MBK1661781.1 hypothetical protein [Paracraurococcus ruber]TDG11230.1 hypothetical protein E2C05_30940 [Paracraurococcus ruber]